MSSRRNNLFKVPFKSMLTPLNAGLFISRGRGIHPRRIIDSFELIFVVHGKLDIEENGIAYTIEKNQSLILQPGVLHFGTQPYPRDLQFYWLHFRIKETIETPYDKISIQKHGMVSRATRLTQLFAWYISDQESSFHYPEMKNILLYQIIAEAGFSEAVHEINENDINFHAKRAYEMIKTRYSDDISTKTIASDLRCNPDYLGRVFNNGYGMPIIQILKETRIGKAKELLMENKMNISEIAYACGFNNLAYFRNTFKEFTGVTPKLFRESYSKMHINTE